MSSGGGISDSSTGGGGDWICSDVTCRHLNFARRTQCNKCHRARSSERTLAKSGGLTKKKLGTEIGKAAAEKSRGLFSAEDWQCSKCANVNWARRQTCNMCNAPRFCDVEERTGYGGGYNDRGVVEYKEREESDSEYDEFGRLKKRKKNSEHSSEITKRRLDLKKGSQKDIDEEDDEEEGDEEDLAKYDLFGDEDDNLSNGLGSAKQAANVSKKLDRKDRSPVPKRSHSESSSSSDSRNQSSRSSSVSSSSSTTTSSSSYRSRSNSRTRKSSKSRSRSRQRTVKRRSLSSENKTRSANRLKSTSSQRRCTNSSKSRSRSRSSSRSTTRSSTRSHHGSFKNEKNRRSRSRHSKNHPPHRERSRSTSLRRRR